MKEFKKVKKGFSKNLTEMFSKTMFHNVPNILKYIDEIEDKRKREQYPRLPIRIIGDSLYPSQEIFRKLRELDIEYIFVLKDKKIPSITEEFFTLVSLPEGERFIMETKEATILTMWANEIDYNGEKVNVIRQIRRNKEDGSNSVWMWITNREITRMNVSKIIYCGKQRSYIENQGFKEQKITSGIELEHVYSKNIKAIRVIYGIIQIVHLILQIIEHC